MALRDLQDRLLVQVRQEISNGGWTERRLAKLIGISQPHMHHVLKGARSLTPAIFDLLLRQLGITVLDLHTAEELQDHLRRRETWEGQPKPS